MASQTPCTVCIARLVLAMAPLLVLGCHRQSSPFIAVIPRTTGNALWQPVLSGVTNAVGSHAGIYSNAPARQEDVEDQVALINKELDRSGMEGLILAPDHSVALISPVQRAREQGIPVVVLSTALEIPPGNKLSYVLNDDAWGGQLAADRLGKVLGGKGTVALLGIDIGNLGSQERQNSFETSLDRAYPGIKIVTKRFGSSNQPHEQEVAAEVLARFPQLSAILSLNSTATRGAYFALSESHKAGIVKLIGFDQDTDSIRNENIDSIVVQDTYRMGYIAGDTILAQLQGKPVRTLVKLKPVLITRDNLNSPEIQEFLRHNWRLVH
jgi:ribose transport system substrate-binding protein